MKRAQPQLERVQEGLKNSLFFKQQIEHEAVRRLTAAGRTTMETEVTDVKEKK
jgi:hypothetical protein